MRTVLERTRCRFYVNSCWSRRLLVPVKVICDFCERCCGVTVVNFLEQWHRNRECVLPTKRLVKMSLCEETFQSHL